MHTPNPGYKVEIATLIEQLAKYSDRAVTIRKLLLNMFSPQDNYATLLKSV